jgi:hypothetical protein
MSTASLKKDNNNLHEAFICLHLRPLFILDQDPKKQRDHSPNITPINHIPNITSINDVPNTQIASSNDALTNNQNVPSTGSASSKTSKRNNQI